jgi:hypothetical protein
LEHAQLFSPRRPPRAQTTSVKAEPESSSVTSSRPWNLRTRRSSKAVGEWSSVKEEP